MEVEEEVVVLEAVEGEVIQRLVEGEEEDVVLEAVEVEVVLRLVEATTVEGEG